MLVELGRQVVDQVDTGTVVEAMKQRTLGQAKGTDHQFFCPVRDDRLH